MRHSKIFLFLVVFVICMFPIASTCRAEAALLSEEDAKTLPSFRFASLARVWDQGDHNAFPDLIHYRGQWVLSFREAPEHAGGVEGSKLIVLTSDDGVTWVHRASLSDPREDIRTGKLAITSAGELMLLTAIQLFDQSTQRHQSLVYLLTDAEQWKGPLAVGHADYWMWNINWHGDRGYTIAYRTTTDEYIGRMYATADGRAFDVLVDSLGIPGANESDIAFDDDVAFCLLRVTTSRGERSVAEMNEIRKSRPGYPNLPAYLGMASPPYEQWEWRQLDEPIGSPTLVSRVGPWWLAVGGYTVRKAYGPRHFYGSTPPTGAWWRL